MKSNMDLLKLLDKSDKDYEKAAEFCKIHFLKDCSGYGNGHEMFMISDLNEKDFNKIVKALLEHQEEKPYTFYGDCNFSTENGKKYLLEVNTAKDYDKEALNAVIEKCDFKDKPTYFQDCWDYLNYLEFDKNSCKLVELGIEHNESEYYDMDFVVRDNSTGVFIGFGAGYLAADIISSLYETALSLEKAEDYEEREIDLGWKDYLEEEAEK